MRSKLHGMEVVMPNVLARTGLRDGLLAALLLLACTAVTPPRAHAEADVADATAVVFALGIPATLLVAQVVYAAQGSWSPTGLAVVELGCGFLFSIMGASILGDTTFFGPGLGVGLLGVGLWFTTHALISLVVNNRKPHPTPPPVEAAVLPMGDGVWAGVRIHA